MCSSAAANAKTTVKIECTHTQFSKRAFDINLKSILRLCVLFLAYPSPSNRMVVSPNIRKTKPTVVFSLQSIPSKHASSTSFIWFGLISSDCCSICCDSGWCIACCCCCRYFSSFFGDVESRLRFVKSFSLIRCFELPFNVVDRTVAGALADDWSSNTADFRCGLGVLPLWLFWCCGCCCSLLLPLRDKLLLIPLLLLIFWALINCCCCCCCDCVDFRGAGFCEQDTTTKYRVRP